MLKLAFRNILRHKLKTAMTLAAVIFGVISLILSGGFIQDVFVQLGETTIHSQTGHIQIFRTGYFEKGSRSPEKFSIERPEIVQNLLVGMPEVAEVMARLSFSGMVNNGYTDLAFIGEGVEPEKENRLGTSLILREGRHLHDDGSYEAMIGVGVARTLKLSPGDFVTLLVSTAGGAVNSMEFKVIGVFQSYSKEYDARAIRIPLKSAKDLLYTYGVTNIVVRLHQTNDTQRVTTNLKNQVSLLQFEIKTWIELNDFYSKTVTLYSQQFYALQAVILIVVLLGVANTVSMSIIDRVGEFGTIMALGYRAKYIFGLILLENILLGLVGAACGLILGYGIASFISAVGIPMPPPPNSDLGYIARIQVIPSSLIMAFLIGAIATILAAIIPAIRVSRIPVVQALRYNI